MTLWNTLRKKSFSPFATATPATVATHKDENGVAVAKVATVAVANSNFKKFSDPTCPWREVLTLPLPDGGKEETPGCVNPRITPGINTWRRLSRLDSCPARWRMNRPYTST